MNNGPTRQHWEEQTSQWCEDRALWLGLLLDAWTQWSIPSGKDGEKRWAGALTTLEDIESCLRSEGMIDEHGVPTGKGLK